MMKKKNIMKFAGKIIFCLALMVCLLGCDDTSETTDTYTGIAIISVLAFGVIAKYMEGSNSRTGTILAILCGLAFVVFVALGIISYCNDKKYDMLFKNSSVISSCIHIQNFSNTHRIKIEQPFIIIKEVENEGKDGQVKNAWVLVHYSEKGGISEKAIENLKTVVIVKDVFSTSYDYGRYGNKATSIRVYNAKLTCFDLINRQYDERPVYNDFKPPKKTDRGGTKKVSDGEIIKIVYGQREE